MIWTFCIKHNVLNGLFGHVTFTLKINAGTPRVLMRLPDLNNSSWYMRCTRNYAQRSGDQWTSILSHILEFGIFGTRNVIGLWIKAHE